MRYPHDDKYPDLGCKGCNRRQVELRALHRELERQGRPEPSHITIWLVTNDGDPVCAYVAKDEAEEKASDESDRHCDAFWDVVPLKVYGEKEDR